MFQGVQNGEINVFSAFFKRFDDEPYQIAASGQTQAALANWSLWVLATMGFAPLAYALIASRPRKMKRTTLERCLAIACQATIALFAFYTGSMSRRIDEAAHMEAAYKQDLLALSGEATADEANAIQRGWSHVDDAQSYNREINLIADVALSHQVVLPKTLKVGVGGIL